MFFEFEGAFVKANPDAVIFWVGPHLYMFPILSLAKSLGIKVIHWGHRRPMPPNTIINKFMYNFEHWMDDAVILYAENLRQYVFKQFQSKTFVANNTLNLTTDKSFRHAKEEVKGRYGIHTNKNII